MCLSPQFLIRLYIYFLIRLFSDIKDVWKYTIIGHSKIRACQLRDHDFKWEWNIQCLHRNNPHLNVFALQWWTFALRSRYGHLRHGMDIAVMFGSFVVTPIRNIPVVHRTRLLDKNDAEFPPVHIAIWVTFKRNYKVTLNYIDTT